MPTKVRNPAAYAAAIKRNARKAPLRKRIGRTLRRVARPIVRGIRKGGNAFMTNALRAAGSAAGQRLITDLGFIGAGDYAASPNVHMAHVKRTHNARTGSRFTVSHKEYLGDLLTSNATTSLASGSPSAYSTQTYTINPGLSSSFPWLSSVAANFSKYRFHKLVYYIKSTCSDAIASVGGIAAGLGEVCLSVQYDVMTGAFTNMSQQLNAEGSISTKPSNSTIMGIECKDTPYDWYFTRTGNVPAGGTSALYDLALVQFATQNVPSTVTSGAFVPINIAQIFVEYTVELDVPILGQFTNQLSAHYYGSGASGGTMFAGPPVAMANNQLSLTFSGNTMYFPSYVIQGSYLVTYYLNCATGGANCSVGVPTVTNGTLAGNFWNDAAANHGQAYQMAPGQAGVTSKGCSGQFIVDVNAPGVSVCSVTWGTLQPGAGGNGWDLIVTPYNDSMQ